MPFNPLHPLHPLHPLQVQCLSVLDAVSDRRVSCPQTAPRAQHSVAIRTSLMLPSDAAWLLPRHPSHPRSRECPQQCCSQRFCDEACPSGLEGDTSVQATYACKVVAAGCSKAVMECPSGDVENGECEGCRRPFWCTDHDINRGDDWIDAYFYDEDKDYRQCRWRPSELESEDDRRVTSVTSVTSVISVTSVTSGGGHPSSRR